MCILHTGNVTEHRATRTRPVVAANGLSLICQNPLRDIKTTLTSHLEPFVKNLPAYKKRRSNFEKKVVRLIISHLKRLCTSTSIPGLFPIFQGEKP